MAKTGRKMRIRSFLALPLPDEAVSAIGEFQRLLKRKNLKTRWVRPENIHITLKFLGDIDEDEIFEIEEKVSEAAQNFSAFSLRAQGVGFFPGAKNARIIWTGVLGDTNELFCLQKKIEERLESFREAGKKFRSHATLGRIKGKIPKKEMAELLSGSRGFKTPLFICDKIILYRSDMKKDGPVYAPLKIWRLSGFKKRVLR